MILEKGRSLHAEGESFNKKVPKIRTEGKPEGKDEAKAPHFSED